MPTDKLINKGYENYIAAVQERRLRRKNNLVLAVVLLFSGFIAITALMRSPGSTASQEGSSPTANPCPAIIAHVEKDTELWVDLEPTAAYYHMIPSGDPVGTTGKCSGAYAEVIHRGQTGWVFQRRLR